MAAHASPSRTLVRTAYALVALTAFLLVFGSTVRVNEAGLACPDWPLCFGVVVPTQMDLGVFLEFGHRVVAGIVSLWFVGQSVVLWRRGLLAGSGRLKVLVPLAAVVLATQVVLGGLTVLELLAGWTVASRLVTGNTFAALLLLTALTLHDLSSPARRGGVVGAQRWVASALLVLVPAQVVLGGWVAGNHAGLACGTWPSCNGAGWFPTFAGPVGWQVSHRVLAYTLCAVALGNLAVQWRSDRLRRPAMLLVAVVALQAGLGITNVLMQLPPWVTLAHSAGAAALFLTTTWQAFEVWTAPVAASAPATIGAALEAK